MELKSLTQRIECMKLESWSLRMLSECLGVFSMRLGVPFIAPRQLGAVEDQQGRLSLPSIEWCTEQSGVPPDRSYRWSGARLPSKSGTDDSCSYGPVGTPDTVRCTPDSPVHTGQSGAPADRWSYHASLADCTADHWRLATVGSPDSPVHHRTVR
jgi:hypothetical protein